MAKIEELKQKTDIGLSGLQATDQLKYRILRAARDKNARKHLSFRQCWTIGLSSALALALVIILPITMNSKKPTLIISQPAGDSAGNPILTANKGISYRSINDASEASMDTLSSIWEGNDSSFPLVLVNGRYYRMMKTGSLAVSKNLIGSVDLYSSDISTYENQGIFSNILPVGTQVYSVNSMQSTLVCAEFDSGMRYFQRVSYNGCSIVDGERFTDTLQVSNHIVSMTLQGSGAIDDPEVCEKLFSILASSATLSSSSISGKQILSILLDNGISLQLKVGNGCVSACGTWSCPQFFEAFQEKLQ